DSGNADFHCDYAYVLAHLGHHDQAAEEFATALRLNPKSGRIHYNFAMFLAENNESDQAMAEFQKCVELNPKSAEAHYYLGHMFFVKGDMESAKTHYVETTRLDPTAPVHNSLGVVYMRLGEVSQAVEQFNEALRMHPDDADAAENLRVALASGGTANSSPR